MKVSVIGVEHKSGTFTNDAGKSYDFDNYNLHCTRESNRVYGEAVSILKVKADLFSQFMAGSGFENPQDVVGRSIESEENRYGKVVSLDLVED